jgi:hypothetical protein
MNTTQASALMSTQILRAYYAATLIFVVLDYFFSINVRLAFLEAWPEMRVIYYLLCFVCLGMTIWWPAWSLWIGTIESMLSLSLLIVTMGARVMSMSEQMLRTGSGLITMSEITNFLIVSGAAWVAYMRGIAAVKKQSGLRL